MSTKIDERCIGPKVKEGCFSEIYTGKRITASLLQKVSSNNCSIDYVNELEFLVEKFPSSFEVFYFLGILAYAQGDNQKALELLYEAWEKRQLNRYVIDILCKVLEGRNDKGKYYPLFRALLCLNQEDMWKLKRDGIWKEARFFLIGPRLAPLAPFICEDGQHVVHRLAMFEALPYGRRERPIISKYPYRVGLHISNEFPLRTVEWFKDLFYANRFANNWSMIYYDVVRMCRSAQESLDVNVKDVPCVVYVLGEGSGNWNLREQKVLLEEKDERPVELNLYPLTTMPIRINAPARLSAKTGKIAISRPILLQHKKGRRKLVLNILADALSWKMEKSLGFPDVPNIRRFFKQGVIFDDNFSVAEHTYPSLASIETGMHLHRSQVFNNNAMTVLNEKYHTLSESMSDLGYFSVALMEDVKAFANGVGRGYERWVMCQDDVELRASLGIERLIRHLQAFNETDNFILVHFCDSHDVGGNGFLYRESAMTHFSPKYLSQKKEKSVFQQPTLSRQTENHEGIRYLDRLLGMLFDYIDEHYKKDEVMINLYSDHGMSIYDNDWIMADNHVGAALMCYGGGVPALGHVNELTSNLDLYKIMGHVLGFPADMDYLDGELPKAFGGKGHEYVITNSIYPGQTYKLAIRTKEHEFRLETKDLTADDGTVDMSDFVYRILNRKTHEDVEDSFLANYFLEIAKQHTKPFWRLLE